MKGKRFHDSMKVTVSFGDVRVVVPCGNGDIFVRDLMEDAVVRYKKAAGLSPFCKVSVRRLKLGVDGGILDEGDRVSDVVEDKDQIIADFKAYDLETSHRSLPSSEVRKSGRNRSGVEVDGRLLPVDDSKFVLESSQRAKDARIDPQIDLNSNWMVNSGAKIIETPSKREPFAKNRTGPAESKMMASDSVSGVGTVSHHLQHGDHIQTPLLKKILKKSKDEEKRKVDSEKNRTCSSDGSAEYLTSSENISSFARDSSRKSLSNQLVMSKWFDAQERALDAYENENKRPEQRSRPSAQPSARPSSFSNDEGIHWSDSLEQTGSPCGTGVIQLRNRNTGTVDQGVKSWRLSFYGQTAASPIHSASNPMYQSLSTSTRKKRRAPEPPRTSSSTDGRLASSGKVAAPSRPCPIVASDVTPCQNIAEHAVTLPPILVKSPSVEDGQCRTFGGMTDSQAMTIGNSSPLSFKSPSDQKSTNRLTPSMKGVLAPTNTRLIGRKISVELTKGSRGLGFSITTRDNVAIDDCPIYIKNILPVGAAIEDGRLKSGDRLLRVNQEDMTGKTQSEAAQILRNIPVNSTVEILVSRQVLSGEDFESSDMTESDANISTAEARISDAYVAQENVGSLKKDATNPCSAVSDVDANFNALCTSKRTCIHSEAANESNLLTFEIPWNSSSAVDIGFNMVKEEGQDCGIFVKKAKFKDCPLVVNDQLIEVNGISLIGKSNSKAIEIVKEALKQPSKSGIIQVKVSRYRNASSVTFPLVLSDKEAGSSIANRFSAIPQESICPGEFKTCNVTGNEKSVDGSAKTFEENNLRNELSPSAVFRAMRRTDNSADDFSDAPKVIERELVRVSESDERPASDNGSEDFMPDDSFDHTESVTGFNREGFGRQSISEKRKGHADPSSFDIYQKIKSSKDKKMDYDSRSWDPRKSTLNKSTERRRDESFSKLGKKSKSMEDLHLLEQEQSRSSHEAMQPVRKNNPSFLMAVDPYYESPTYSPLKVAGRDPESHPADSILTLSKASIFSKLARTDKKKSEKDLLKSIMKKGTDIFRFSKPRKSVDSKDGQDIQQNLSRESKSTFWVSGDSDEVTPSRRKYTSILSDPESPYIDSYSPLLSGNECELEVTHFGADCVTKVIRDNCSQGQVNFLAENKSMNSRDLKQGQPVELKTNKFQQLRSEFQRHHQERQGQYPLDDVEDQYEKRLRAQERSHISSQQSAASILNHPLSSRRMDNGDCQPQTRTRPQPISAHPEISAQFERLEGDSESPAGHLSHGSHYSFSAGHRNSYNQPANSAQNSNFYGYRDGDWKIPTRPREPTFLESTLANLDNRGVDSGCGRVCGRDELRRSAVHRRQESSPVSLISAIPPAMTGDRRHSFSEKLPDLSSCHLEQATSIYIPPSPQMPSFGAVYSQSSHV